MATMADVARVAGVSTATVSHVINNTRFLDAPPSPAGPQMHIWMGYAAAPTRNLIAKDEVLVYRYNRIAGNDFQAYYSQQHPTFVVPQTVYLIPYSYKADGVPAAAVVGSPDAGLTNQQNWTKHGIAIAGAVAPCTTTRPEVTDGFACPPSVAFSPPDGGTNPPPAPPAPPSNVRIVS